MAGMLRVRRSRGAFSGVLLVLLGIWGGLVPLVGPYVNYAYTPDRAWTLNSGRIWLELLPAAATLVGGLIVMASRMRPAALFGATLAVLSGAWFALGGTLVRLWSSTAPGVPVGGPTTRILEQVGFFAGLGIVIVCVASVALGRLSLVAARDVPAARPSARRDAVAPADAGRRPAGAGARSWSWSRSGSGSAPAAGPSDSAGPADTAAADDGGSGDGRSLAADGDRPDGSARTGFLRKVAAGSGSSRE